MQHKDRRQDILRAAMELFAKKGFRGTTTRDLAAHADVNEAIIFRYFKTKEELYRAILEEKMQHGRAGKDEELSRLAEISCTDHPAGAIVPDLYARRRAGRGFVARGPVVKAGLPRSARLR